MSGNKSSSGKPSTPASSGGSSGNSSSGNQGNQGGSSSGTANPSITGPSTPVGFGKSLNYGKNKK